MEYWFVAGFRPRFVLPIARFGDPRVCIVMQGEMMTGSSIGMVLPTDS